jgi:hypothetical protein
MSENWNSGANLVCQITATSILRAAKLTDANGLWEKRAGELEIGKILSNRLNQSWQLLESWQLFSDASQGVKNEVLHILRPILRRRFCLAKALALYKHIIKGHDYSRADKRKGKCLPAKWVGR